MTGLAVQRSNSLRGDCLANRPRARGRTENTSAPRRYPVLPCTDSRQGGTFPRQVLLPVHRLCLASLLGRVQLNQQFLHCAGGPGIGLNVLMHDVVHLLVAIDAGGGIQDPAFTLSLYSWLEDEPNGMPAKGNGRKSGYSIRPVDSAGQAGAPASPEAMPIRTLIC